MNILRNFVIAADVSMNYATKEASTKTQQQKGRVAHWPAAAGASVVAVPTGVAEDIPRERELAACRQSATA